MLRSLFAGISGLRVNQTMLDVTGNNIANANTTGFKSSSTVFQDTLSQMLTGASGSNTTTGRGGTNPIQVGLGVQLGATALNMNQGSAQTTGRATDMMINGDGLFMVKPSNTTEMLYTRAGAFSFDDAKNLVNPSGAIVQGYDLSKVAANGTFPAVEGLNLGTMVDNALAAETPAVTPKPDLTSYNIGSDGKITGVFSDDKQRELGQIALANFPNPMGLEKVGGTAFRASNSSGARQVGAPGSGQLGTLSAGTLEMSNVDLAQEFTNLILAQRGFQASSRVITTSDSVLEELVNLKR
jgi:flagellar hook protein FlgE